jgi:hypothetical protein
MARRHMRRLYIIFIGLWVTSCSVQQVTERMTARNLNRLDEVTADILKLNLNIFLVDTLQNGVLKKSLKKANVETVKMFTEKHEELGQDSLIVLSRHNFMLTFGEIVIDFKKKERELAGVGGLRKIGPRTYFRKKTLAIS